MPADPVSPPTTEWVIAVPWAVIVALAAGGFSIVAWLLMIILGAPLMAIGVVIGYFITNCTWCAFCIIRGWVLS